MNKQKKDIDRRAFGRVSSMVLVYLYYGGSIHFGTATDFSENGMFIRTRIISAPLNKVLELSIPSRDSELNIPIRVKRIVTKDNYNEGFGVELVNMSKDYSNFVKGLKK
jgi:hypothetical protein